MRGIPSSSSFETGASAYMVRRRVMCGLIELLSVPGRLTGRPAAYGRAAPRISEVHSNPNSSQLRKRSQGASRSPEAANESKRSVEHTGLRGRLPKRKNPQRTAHC